MSREDQYSVTVNIDNTDLGVFDKLTGGEIDSEESKFRPGGMASQVSLGGYKTVSNLTVSRLYDLARDHLKVQFLLERVGKGSATISKQPLDVNGNPFGAPIVYTGKLKQVKLPDHDSESADAAMIELEFSPNATVS